MTQLEDLNEAETRLQQAMLADDVAALDMILHDQVRFVGPDGITIDKQQDLAAHRSGTLAISALDQVERDTQIIANVGITRVKLHLLATVEGNPVDVVMVYTRAWSHNAEGWTVVAAHAGMSTEA